MNNSAWLNKMIIRKALIPFLLILCNSLLSCVVSRPPYPKDWQPLIRNAPLESFSGQYHPTLIKIISRDTSSKTDIRNCKADFNINDDLAFKLITKCTDHSHNLIYSGNNDDKLLTENLNTTKISVRNKKKGILIKYKTPSAGNPLVGFSKEYTLLSKSNDGSLIIKNGNWAYGLVFFIIPVGVNEYIWYRLHDNTVDIRKKENP